MSRLAGWAQLGLTMVFGSLGAKLGFLSASRLGLERYSSFLPMVATTLGGLSAGWLFRTLYGGMMQAWRESR